MPLPMNLDGSYPPLIITPDFWPADEYHYRSQLDRCLKGHIEVIGKSAGGRDLWGVTYHRSDDAPTLCVCGGMHGHESQGPAACFNHSSSSSWIAAAGTSTPRKCAENA